MSRRPSPQPVNKKTVPYCVKRNDGDPITRTDLQYDLLHHIFSDDHAVFTSPGPTLSSDPPGTKTTFHDLYINALIRSPRASKVLREKMVETPEFGTDFAKLALLANVGRINTTMAFFPEMKTAIRTYHPIPALQKTNGNLQDAPRIKNILKSCLLDGESKAGVPSTPVDILARSRSGSIPPTSIVNLIFVMANHSAPLAQMHFDGPFEFLDLFLPINVSSASRARAFLWLCYHYLESSADNASRNPFSEPHSSHPNKIPSLITLTPEEMELENVDSPDEIAWGEKMLLQRKEFQAQQDKGRDKKAGDGDEDPADGAEEVEKKGRTRVPIKDPVAAKATAKEKKAAADRARRLRQKEAKREREAAAAAASVLDAEDTIDNLQPDHTSSEHKTDDQQPPQPHSSEKPSVTQTFQSSRRARSPSPHRRERYDPYKQHDPKTGTVASRQTVSRSHPQSRTPHRHWKDPSSTPQRTMLQQAWHIVTTTDPLVDSDDENADEHVRLDYVRKLHIVSQLRRKETTPEPQYQNTEMGVGIGL